MQGKVPELISIVHPHETPTYSSADPGQKTAPLRPFYGIHTPPDVPYALVTLHKSKFGEGAIHMVKTGVFSPTGDRRARCSRKDYRLGLLPHLNPVLSLSPQIDARGHVSH